MDTGVTQETRERLQEAAKLSSTERGKAVILLWDEMHLGLGLHYDEVTDKIVGLEDWGNRRTDDIADEALVFMLRFIDPGDTMALSFNFSNHQTTTTQLLYCIKEDWCCEGGRIEHRRHTL